MRLIHEARNIAIRQELRTTSYSGKHGVIAYDSHDRYAGLLGFYCKQHPTANLIESSERILAELDRGL